MDVRCIPIDQLVVSDVNVRKILTGEDDESNIIDLSNDIKTNGLINPLTVRMRHDGKYEVIAGQRRLLAIKLLDWVEIPCNILGVDDQKAEELSLVENVQRNQMTFADRVNAYSRLYKYYKDIDKVSSVVHLASRTLEKYIKISKLPRNVIDLLDVKGNAKITIDVAVELSKLDSTKINIKTLCEEMGNITNDQKLSVIKTIIKSNYQTSISDTIQEAILASNSIKLAPSCPYVIDKENDRYVIIPENLYSTVLQLINTTKV